MLSERRTMLGVAALLLSFGRAASVAAQSGDRDRAELAIVISYDPASVQLEPAIEAVRSHLTGMPVRVVVEPVSLKSSSLSERLEIPGGLAARRKAIGAVSMELSPHGDVLVFFTEPDGRAALVRRVPSSSGDLSVLREEAAIVVRSLVQALIDGKRIGLTDSNAPSGVTADELGTPPSDTGAPEPKSESAPEAPLAEPSDRATVPAEASVEQPKARRPALLAVSGGYVGTAPARELPWQSGLLLGARWFALPSAYVGASYAFFPTVVSGSERATIALKRHPVELAAGYEGSSPLALTGELALMVDVIHRSTLQAGTDFRGTSDRNSVAWGLGARGGLCWGPTDWLRGMARVGVDVAGRRQVYVARRDDTDAVVTPALVSPRIELGLVAYVR